MKLTKAQQDVVDLMRDGWSLGKSVTFDGGAWLQKDGLGRGGKTRRVNGNTFYSLCQKGVIKSRRYSFPTTEYFLTDDAK